MKKGETVGNILDEEFFSVKSSLWILYIGHLRRDKNNKDPHTISAKHSLIS